jgi:hypothetical protein
MDTLIYKAYVSNKRVRIWHRFFNNRDEYALSITGGKWNVGTLFLPRLGLVLNRMREEIEGCHPRAKWHVILDNTDKVPTYVQSRNSATAPSASQPTA